MTKNNKRLLKQAKQYLVGGVNSPVRSFSSLGIAPILIDRGSGSKIYDHDNNVYTDYMLSFGALILGHAPKVIVDAVQKKISLGLCFGATNVSEIELARQISQAIPAIENIRFTVSGTEAVMGAIRLARGFTGRKKIVKFVNSYHGHADYLLAQSGSGLATAQIPISKGVIQESIKNTIVIPYGDKKSLECIFQRYSKQIAAVIVEPVGGNYGVVSPDKAFLRLMRQITHRDKALLIFDEVITGFRFHYGSAAQLLGVKPDLMCLGKVIGGGLPVGAFGGSKRIMRHLAPLGGVYHASTFSGNPVVMEAGIKTLQYLRNHKEIYKKLIQNVDEIVGEIQKVAQAQSIVVSVASFGTMFSIKFEEQGLFARFYRKSLESGIYFAPSEYEANFISFAHTKKDIQTTKRAMQQIFCFLSE